MTPETMERFTDPKLTIVDFMDEILVVCPQCGSCASVLPLPRGKDGLFSPRRLSCGNCGLVNDKKLKAPILGNSGEPVDSYFGLPLWLVAHSVDNALWAYNLRHLNYIEAFVRATIRTRRLDPPGWSNRSVISRLPRWIKKTTNRKRVLALIQELKDSELR